MSFSSLCFEKQGVVFIFIFFGTALKPLLARGFLFVENVFFFLCSYVWRSKAFHCIYCIFIAFNPLEAISCNFVLVCAETFVVCPPPNPSSKPGLNPPGGGNGHRVKPLAKTILNKGPEICTGHARKSVSSVIGGCTTYFSILRRIPMACRIEIFIQ